MCETRSTVNIRHFPTVIPFFKDCRQCSQNCTNETERTQCSRSWSSSSSSSSIHRSITSCCSSCRRYCFAVFIDNFCFYLYMACFFPYTFFDKRFVFLLYLQLFLFHILFDVALLCFEACSTSLVKERLFKTSFNNHRASLAFQSEQ